MVGRLTLDQVIGVRVPARQQSKVFKVKRPTGMRGALRGAVAGVWASGACAGGADGDAGCVARLRGRCWSVFWGDPGPASARFAVSVLHTSFLIDIINYFIKFVK